MTHKLLEINHFAFAVFKVCSKNSDKLRTTRANTCVFQVPSL